MRIYSRMKAVQYALKYAINYNPEWPSDKGYGGDCTNFVSQALHAGGWTMVYPGSLFGGAQLWHSPKAGTSRMWMNRSRSWAAASNFNDYLGRSDRATRCKVSELTFGDVVLLKDYGIVYHTMIVTDMQPIGGTITPILTYHTTDTLAKPISDLSPNILLPWKIKDIFTEPAPNPVLPRAG